MRLRLIVSFSAAVLSATLLFGQAAFAAEQNAKAPVIVFAAASLKNALDKVASDWQQESGQSVKTSYAASSTLAKQMEEDAPAQIFISADLDWMDYAAKKGLIKPESRTDLLGNALVLVAPER